MKLSRITKIRGHRVFREFSWPNDLHAFGQFNLIYGLNGCGKTTLSSLLAMLEKRLSLMEGECELEFDEALKVKGHEFGSASLPQVRVFNRDFINATLQSTDGIAAIYFLGKDTIEKQAQVSKLKKDVERVNGALITATNEKKDAESKLDNFCIAKAKFIKELLTTANSLQYNNYDKRRFRQAADQLTEEAAMHALLSDDDKSRLRRQKDSQPKNPIQRVVLPSVDLPKLEAEVIQLEARSLISQTLDELTKDADVANWVRTGLALHSNDRHSDTCRFCRNPFSPDRRSAIEAHFSEAFASFQNELETRLSELKKAKENLGSIKLPDVARFYDHLVAEATDASEKLKAVISEVETALDTLIERIEVKRNSPFTPITTAVSSSQTPDGLIQAAKAFNEVVDKHNKTTEDFKRSVDEACKKLELAYVAEERKEYLELVEAAKNAGTVLDNNQRKAKTIQNEIEQLERQILEHRRPADELTDELRAYLGRDELRFEVKGTGYALTRNGQPVSNLSESERTAITFLYFLKSLQDKNFDLANGIVVIDDPVSSLDANALFSAFGYMKERTKNCGQLFIFTHSFPFFRLVKNWFHHLPKQRSPNTDRRPARFFMLRSRRHVDGSRTSHIECLDPLLEEFESEYQYLFKRIYEEAHRSDVHSLEHHYGLPNVARRLLEAFLAFRFPDLSSDLNSCFERINFDNAKKTRILRLLNTYSHAGAISEPEHDLSLLSETQPVLRDLLELMEAVDKDHYDSLKKILPPIGGLS